MPVMEDDAAVVMVTAAVYGVGWHSGRAFLYRGALLPSRPGLQWWNYKSQLQRGLWTRPS